MSIYIPFRGRNRNVLLETIKEPRRDRLYNHGGPPFDWSGTFRTVGTGKQYTSLNQAISVSKDGDMILIYTSHTNPDSWISRKLFIRGMGATPSDIVLSGDYTLAPAANSDIMVENLAINPSGPWQRAFTIWGNAKVFANKVSIPCDSSYDYPIGGQWYDPGARSNTGLSTFQNCYIKRGYTHLSWLTLNNIALIKTQLDQTLHTTQCTGTLSVNDTVTSATSGYGVSYGDLIITNEFLNAHGMI